MPCLDGRWAHLLLLTTTTTRTPRASVRVRARASPLRRECLPSWRGIHVAPLSLSLSTRTFTLHTLSHYVFEKNLAPLTLPLTLSSLFSIPVSLPSSLGCKLLQEGVHNFFPLPEEAEAGDERRKFASTQKPKKKRKSNLSHELCVSTPRSRTVSKA